MNAKTLASTVPPSGIPQQPSKPDLDPIGQNIENILGFYLREERNITRSQRTLETISSFLGRPFCLGAIVLFVALWILANVLVNRLGFATIDPPPFFWLQGMVGLGAFLTMIVVLIKQNRLAKIEERRAHLELQVNLLTEQKTTKLINLIEELRRDSPMVKDRHDAEATVFQQPTDPESVLAALDERLDTAERATDTAENKKKASK